MYTNFRNSKIRKLCEKRDHAVKRLGPQQATLLFKRIGEIRAALTLADLRKAPGPHCHPLIGDRKGFYAISLVQPSRLILLPVCEQKVFDEKFVFEIEIIEIVEDYH